MTAGEGGKKPSLRVLKGELESAPEAAAPGGQGAGQELSDKARDHVEKTTGKRPGKRQGPPSGDARPGEIWRDCPVKALGVHGATSWYVDWLGQVRDVRKHDRDTILHIFGGREDVLRQHYKRTTKGGDVVIGWDQAKAAAAMQRAAAEQGIWNPLQRLRGLGAWLDGDGGVILHCGDAILHRGEWRDPGEIDGYVYPSDARIPRPLAPDAKTEGAAGKLMAYLESWRWQRGELDAILLLGWMGCAMFGGALRWRPLVWLTGDAGTGKSTLQDLIGHVLGGEGALLQSSDATAPSLWQTLGCKSLPVALDEVEPDVDARSKLTAIIKFARQAASGGLVMRGGADHKGQEFRARSCFLLSSILRPAMLDQDLSRMALLELDQLGRGAKSPVIRPDEMRRIGQALRTRILLRWGDWGETLELYRAALAGKGHSARGADQFGTLLAMADLCLRDTVPTPAWCETWAEKLAAHVITDQVDQARDWQRLAGHLLTQQLDPWRKGVRYSVASLCMAAADIGTFKDGRAPSIEPQEANGILRDSGLLVEGRGFEARLLVANRHAQLSKLLENSIWWAPPGQTGVWMQSLRRVPGAEASAGRRFGGFNVRCISVPLPTLLELQPEGDEPSPPDLSGPPDPAEDWID
ncbi:hypothetical protein [Albimonas pacifica]|uniref:DNA primase/helicase n=1 Tax=Albimonas pacifica TaxID=1114924 RepID=A0A1I3JKK5_9RHOB|nr:hypothetical protein [Albimonas pacifica]SFI60405.1 hypothetical protein SAMN05216258_10834 [Albimonas pacifica]